ncbi:MAG: hypothetical protein QHH26_10895 [Armatimonadota bacterium]|nr:hypothetical protein [Armatimonadota bacterium]
MGAWRIPLAILMIAFLAGFFTQRAVMDTQVRTIADVKAGNTCGGTAVIKGKIIYASDNHFILQDSTGKAELATCPTWYKQIPLIKGEEAIVVGEVLKNPSLLGNCEIILSVYKIFTDHGTIVVRGRPGKPPWMMASRPASD